MRCASDGQIEEPQHSQMLKMDIDQSAEILRLRATIRDLLALSIIPEAWVAREPNAIAADLADLLIGSLKLDFAFVRLCDPTGHRAVEVTRGDCWKRFPEWRQERFVRFGQVSRTEIVTNVGGVEKSCCGVVIPIGVNSERGLIAAACDRSDFPDQIDQQLLSVAANNAATAFQNARLIDELRTAKKTLRDQEHELRKARDELEIKVAERTSELRKSEKELRDAIDTIPSLVWSALPDGSNTYANKRFVEYLGLSAEHTAGSRWHALIHPDDLERHTSKWTEAVATGKPHENESRYRRSDGQYRWHLDRGMPLRDEDGNIVKWYGVTTDIEDRKRAEEALQLVSRDLQDSKTKLEEAQRIAHVGHWEWDLTSNRVIWSDETYRIYGLRPQEYPIDIALIRKLIHPGDSEFVFRVAEEAVRGGLRTDVEHRIIRPSGEVRTVHSQGDVEKDASGRPCKMFGTVQDITDRKRAEQRLRESEAYLAEAQRLSQTGSWAWNPATGDIRYWSEMCYCVLGFDPAGPLPRFEEFLRRIHPDDQTAVRERFEKAIRDKADFELDYRVVHPEKGIRDIHVVGDAVLDGSSLLEFVGTVIDVTERKHSEEALQQSQMYLAEGQRLAHIGSWAFNAAGFEYWSSELFRIYGLDPGGKPPTVEEYLALVHPEDRAFMKQGIAKMLDDHLAFDFTKRIVRPDGEIRHVRCVGVPVTPGGIFQGFLGTGMDVTEQERLTEELRLSENYLSEGQRLAHMGSWAFNPSGFFDYWSQDLFEIYGLDSQKGAPTLEQYLATLHPQDRDSMADTIKRMHAEHCGCDVKKRIVRPDGEQRYIRCVGIPVVEGEVLKGFLGTAMDITEQELLTRELGRQQAHLTEAQKLTHTGSWVWRMPDRKAVHLSEEWYRICGFDPAEGSPTWEEYVERVHPEDRLKWTGITERAIVEKADYDHEFRILLPNGIVKWIRTVGHPVLSAAW